MRLGRVAVLLLVAAPFISGCAGFWSPLASSTSFTLSNSANINVSPGSTGTSTITVTPSSSFTGTVALTCAITAQPTGATSIPTCSFSSASLTFSSTAAQTSTFTLTTSSSTTAGAYDITVTGTSGSVTATADLCAEVSTSSSATCSSASTTSGVFYVLNQTTNQIVAMNITASGQLNSAASALPAQHPFAIAVAPNGKFLYVSTLSGIYLYTIGSGGALTLGNSGMPISADVATTMQVDATNQWLVDAISGSTQINAISINSSTGALASTSEQTFTLPASTPTQLAISPNDSSSCADCYVFVAMGVGGTEAIHFDPANSNPFGAYGTISLINSAGADNTVAVDPQNRLLYVGEIDSFPSDTQSGGLRVFTIASTGVTALSGSPYTIGGTGPSAIQPSSDGNYVYVANQLVSGSSNGNIASFSVSAAWLTFINTFGAGPSGQLGLAEDSTHSYLLAVDSAGGPDLEAYTMSSGSLTSVLSSTTGTDPVGAVAIAAAP